MSKLSLKSYYNPSSSSPLLFHASTKTLVQHFNPNSREKHVPLLFADDLLLFSHGDLHSISILNRALNHFASISGLSINHSKSTFFTSGMDEALVVQVKNLLGFDSGTLPIKYLGVPLISTKLSASDCKCLVDRITQRIGHWASKSLSYAGRSQLIQSVLCSMMHYWSSLFILPKSVLTDVNNILRKFLWSGPDCKSTGAKVAWDLVCRPKDCGGLGFPNIEATNSASALKCIWNILSVKDNLWTKWVKTQLLRNRCFWNIKIPQKCSWNWKKLLQLRGTALSMTKYEIGNGRDTYFWSDNWLEGGPISHRFAPHTLQALNRHLNQKLSDFIVNDSWLFPTPLITLIPELSFLNPPCSSPDKVLWLPSPTKVFTMKHTISWLTFPSIQATWPSLVWSSLSIPRCRFTLWLAALNRLPTLDHPSVAYRHIPNSCYLCLASNETISHLFFSCSYSNQIWNFIQSKCNFHILPNCWKDFVGWASHHWRRKCLRNAVNKLALSTTVNRIWMERNSRAFKAKISSWPVVLSGIKDLIRNRLSSWKVNDSVEMRVIFEEWELAGASVRPPVEPPDAMV